MFGMFYLQFINLLILFVLMRIFLYKPVSEDLQLKRQEEADRQFGEAAAKQSEAEELKTKYQAVLSDAENEKKKVVSEARKTADEEYQRIVADAHKTAAQIKDDAEAEAVMQKKQILKKAEKEIADMVVDAAAKVVAGNSADANSALYDTFLNKAGDKQ